MGSNNSIMTQANSGSRREEDINGNLKGIIYNNSNANSNNPASYQ